jgi:hypothetical protein
VIAMMKENESPRIMYTTAYLVKIGTGFVEKHTRVVIHTVLIKTSLDIGSSSKTGCLKAGIISNN